MSKESNENKGFFPLGVGVHLTGGASTFSIAGLALIVELLRLLRPVVAMGEGFLGDLRTSLPFFGRGPPPKGSSSSGNSISDRSDSSDLLLLTTAERLGEDILEDDDDDCFDAGWMFVEKGSSSRSDSDSSSIYKIWMSLRVSVSSPKYGTN